jgi:GT2 family glycosyltransferase
MPSVTSPLPVSVIIPTRERPQLLRQTVESILAGDSLPAELIVADQSPGERASLPPSDDVNIVHLPLASIGLSRCRNAGIAAARNEVVVFTDDDVKVEADWLKRLVEPLLAAPERTAVTGSVLAPEAGELEGFVPSLTYRTEPETFSGRLFADVLFPNNMAVRRSAFDEVGTFDDRLGPGTAFAGGGEDNDFGYRLLEAGYQIKFVPEAVVYHFGARRGAALVRLHWDYGRGQGAFYAKHMSLSDRYMLRRFLRNAGFRIRRLARVLRGDRQALGEGIYLLGLFSGALGWWRRYGRTRRLAE